MAEDTLSDKTSRKRVNNSWRGNTTCSTGTRSRSIAVQKPVLAAVSASAPALIARLINSAVTSRLISYLSTLRGFRGPIARYRA